MSLRILKELCSVPTAPFAEQHVMRYVERFVAARPRLRLSRDRYGNLLIELPGRSKRKPQPRWIFVAHMDHPGFVAQRMLDDRTLAAAFRGWVHIDYVRGAKVRFFDDRRVVPGVVMEATSTSHDRLTVPERVKVRLQDRVAPGSPGMFDQGAARLKAGKLYSRGCDDQAGAAAALAMLDALHRRLPPVPVAVLLTRAEEEGFIGAIAAAMKPKLLRKTDRLISVECSAVQPYAQQGNGVIIRVGDKTSVFDSDLSYFIAHQAGELSKCDGSFKYQRALMPGGTCEATVFDIYGFTAGALCVPLGNYHNMDREKKRIGPEYIDIGDWRNMVKLFMHITRSAHTYAPGHRLLKQRLEKRFAKLSHLLK
jgi:putative aminopeptidase FrvX